jgi:BirA family biotin operon repressor/biotin-[acetyl-CoA-carboxylase] ligase
MKQKGRCLKECPDLLTPEEIKLGLRTKIFGQQLQCYKTIDSTNEEAKRVALAGAGEGMVIIAERQERGKGRLGREWHSPPELGLWFSLVLRPQIKPAHVSQLTFVSAVAVCKALRKLTDFLVLLKWPNDLLCMDKKICGILTELSAEADRINYLVIGIGLNVNQEEQDFPPVIKDTAISLAMVTGHLWQRAEILCHILYEFEKEYLSYLSKGFSQTLLQWRELNITLGKEVIVSTKEETYTGIAEDINEHGCLLVRKNTGEVVTLWAGDVSLKPKAF